MFHRANSQPLILAAVRATGAAFEGFMAKPFIKLFTDVIVRTIASGIKPIK